MSDIYEMYERNGLTVNIRHDMDPQNPRTEWDNLGVMICSHRNYNLGDEQFNSDEYEGWAELKEHLIEERKAVIVLPLSLYDHSGITMSVGESRGWDSGQVGFIYATKGMITTYFGQCDEASIELAEKCLRDEVHTYDHYLTGEVYGFTTENPRNGEEIDSCWGFYSVEDAKEEANSVADHFVKPHDAAYAKNAVIVHG